MAVAALLISAPACRADSGNASSGNCPDVAIGYFGPLTGPNGVFGQNGFNATKLAAEDYERKSGCTIDVTKFDSQGDPGQAPALAVKAARDERLVGIVGPAFSGPAEAAMPIFDEAGLPVITPNATAPNLAEQGWKVFHRTIGNDELVGRGLAKYLIDDADAKNVAIVDNGSEYGRGNATIAATALEAADVKVSMRGAINPASHDYSSTVVKARSTGVDVVYCGCFYSEAGRLLKQLRGSGVDDVTLIGPSGILAPKFVEVAGKQEAQGTITGAASAALGHFAGYEEFRARWKKAFGTEPGIYSPEAYDAATAFLNAIDAGATERAAVEEWLDKADFKGLSGQIRFDSEGEIVGKRVAIYELDGEQFKFVKEIDAE